MNCVSLGNDGIPKSIMFRQIRNSHGGITYEEMSNLFNVEFKQNTELFSSNGITREMTQETIIEGLPKQIDDSGLRQFITVLMNFTGETIFYDNYVNEVILEENLRRYVSRSFILISNDILGKEKVTFFIKEDSQHCIVSELTITSPDQMIVTYLTTNTESKVRAGFHKILGDVIGTL